MTDAPNALRAFVIMPFGADFDPVWEDLIKPPLANAGFAVSRADSLLNQRNILADVVAGIAEADLIVADVTGLNPNVMYELGLAHGLGKRTVMITQDINELPFDLRPYRANEYTVNFRHAQKLAGLLADVGRAVAEGTADFSNPVQDYAPDKLAAEAQVSAAPRPQPGAHRETGQHSTAALDDEPAEEHPAIQLGFLDGLQALQIGAEKVNDVSVRIGQQTTQIGNTFTGASAKIDKIRKNLGSNRSLQPTLIVARDLAKDLDDYADAMTSLNEELRGAMAEAVSGANAVARYREHPDTDTNALRGEYESVAELVRTIGQSYESTASFAEQMTSLPQIEGQLNAAASRAAATVSDTASILSGAQAEFDRVRAMMKDRLDR
jgi:hypothetical protein